MGTIPFLFLGVTDPVAAGLVDNLRDRNDRRHIAGVAYGGGPEEILSAAHRLFPSRELVFIYQQGIPQDEAIARRFESLPLYRAGKLRTIEISDRLPTVDDMPDPAAVYFSWYTFDMILEQGVWVELLNHRLILASTVGDVSFPDSAIACISADDDEIGREGAGILVKHLTKGVSLGSLPVRQPPYRHFIHLTTAAKRGVEFDNEILDGAEHLFTN